MSIRRTLARTVAVTALGLMGVSAFAEKIEMSEVRRPPKEFLEYGDVIGLSKGTLDRLGVSEGDPVQLTTADGKSAAFVTRVYGDKDDAVFAKKTLRDALGIVDGPVKLSLEPVSWGKGPATATTIEFDNVVKPPVDFLDYGDAVGIGFDAMKSVGGFPGMEGTITGPGGTKDVTVELLDRGNGTIAMKQTLRKKIGVGEGTASVKLEVKASSGTSAGEPNPLYWYKTVVSAIAASREEFRPVLVFAYDGGEESKAFDRLIEDRAVHEALLKTRKYRFAPSEDANSAAFFKTTSVPAVVLLSPEGEELRRLEGNITKPQLISAIGQATSAVKRPSGAAESD